MQQYTDTYEMEHVLDDSIRELNKVNKKLAELLVKKEELTKLVISSLGHDHEGQKSYEYGTYKIEVKTPFIYSLDKELYESLDYQFPRGCNPVKKSTTYTVDKKLVDRLLDSGDAEVRDHVIELFSKKPGKPSVTLKERTV